MNFPSQKRGCIFSFILKSEGFDAKSEGYFELAFTVNYLISCLLMAKVKE